MQSADLLKRRAEIVERHKVLESVPGSGLHADDAEAKARAHAGHALHSERIVAIQDDDRVYVCGPDVAVVLDACKAWLPEGEKVANPQNNVAVYAVKCCKRLLEKPAGDVLDFFTQEWNAILHALIEQKLQVVLTGATA